MNDASHQPSGQQALGVLALGALGVVYGDIGTSPLYAFKESVHGPFAVAPTPENIFGILSLMIWSILLMVVLKYLTILLRADHQGQGGILALLTLLTSSDLVKGRRRTLVTSLGLFGAALLYGDGIITPAVSVLSAVEGLGVTAPGLSKVVVPVTLIILIAVFALQSRGTGKIGVMFGPVVLVWFVCIGGLGLKGLLHRPEILGAANPIHAISFFTSNGWTGFFVLSSVVLVVTGGEALYADLGHFGRAPIRLAWYTVALPALLLNYFGQGALLLQHPDSAHNPFYELAPAWAQIPMILIATAAAVVASQALISASFSLTQQLVNLGYIPRVSIVHTSAALPGQIYVPKVNTFLMIACVLLVATFRTSSSLAAAYGLAVVGTMGITTILFYFVARLHWRWSVALAGSVAGVFLAIEIAFLGANVIKLKQGGWVPLAVGLFLYLLMSTWRKGRLLLADTLKDATLGIEPFMADIAHRKPHRVPGTAVFMTRQSTGVPQVLLHHLKHNGVLHEQVILMSVIPERMPEVDRKARYSCEELGQGMFRILVRHGFMESPNVFKQLGGKEIGGKKLNLQRTSFYFGRETILYDGRGKMSRWRKRLFSLMARNANSATAFYDIPPNRVVELGTQVAL